MTSRSILWRTDFSDYDMLDAMIASVLKKLLNTHVHFRKKRKRRRAARSKIRPILTRETNFLHDLLAFSCNRSLWVSAGTLRFVQYPLVEWRRPRFRCSMGPIPTISKRNSSEMITDRIIFTSMFNWTGKGNDGICISNSEKRKEYAKRFSQGHWMFFGPGHEKKWYGTLSCNIWGKMGLQPLKWWNDSKIPVIQYSRVSVLWVVGSWKRKKQTDHTLQCGCFEHRSHVPNHSFCKSAQYLRNSFELAWTIRYGRGTKGTRKTLEKRRIRDQRWIDNLPKDFCGPGGEIDKSSNDYQTRSCVARSMDENWKSRSETRKTWMEKRGAKTRQCSTSERKWHYWSWWPRLQRNSPTCEEKIGKTYGSSHAVQKWSSD